MAKLLTIPCPICERWMAALITKNNKPHLYCANCGFGGMIRTNEGSKTLDGIQKEIDEADLSPKTLRWYEKKLASSKPDSGD